MTRTASPANKGRKYPAEPLTPPEIKALLAACSRRAATGLRNRALIATLYRGGLRISEALGVSLKDLDQEGCSLRVLKGKGHTSRLVGLDPGAWAILQLWLDKRESLGISRQGPVFCTLAGKRLQTSYIRGLFARLGRRAGIERRCHPHALRHSHAAELATENVPLPVIAAQLGHASTATTDRYVRHLTASEVVTRIKQRPLWL